MSAHWPVNSWKAPRSWEIAHLCVAGGVRRLPEVLLNQRGLLLSSPGCSPQFPLLKVKGIKDAGAIFR